MAKLAAISSSFYSVTVLVSGGIVEVGRVISQLQSEWETLHLRIEKQPANGQT